MFEDHRTCCHEIQISSETRAGREVVEQLLVRMQAANWSEHDVFGVHLAVEEALVNAIKHGNQQDASKLVHVWYQIAADRIQIAIQDEGDGFDPHCVPDPTDEENLEIPSGRGLMLMRSYMSSVEFNDVGNRVVMIKERSPDE